MRWIMKQKFKYNGMDVEIETKDGYFTASLTDPNVKPRQQREIYSYKSGGLDALTCLILWGLITIGVFAIGVLILFSVCRVVF
jgi:hypothetical protein